MGQRLLNDEDSDALSSAAILIAFVRVSGNEREAELYSSFFSLFSLIELRVFMFIAARDQRCACASFGF